jgi:hypothetical protein
MATATVASQTSSRQPLAGSRLIQPIDHGCFVSADKAPSPTALRAYTTTRFYCVKRAGR